MEKTKKTAKRKVTTWQRRRTVPEGGNRYERVMRQDARNKERKRKGQGKDDGMVEENKDTREQKKNSNCKGDDKRKTETHRQEEKGKNEKRRKKKTSLQKKKNNRIMGSTLDRRKNKRLGRCGGVAVLTQRKVEINM